MNGGAEGGRQGGARPAAERVSYRTLKAWVKQIKMKGLKILQNI